MSGRWQPLELPDGSYSDDTRPWSQQDVVGYLPTFAEMAGTRSRLKLVTVPGLNPSIVCGTGPHRGARNVEGKLFVVSGQTLFQVFPDGSVQERGTIPGTGRVSMTHNQVSGGNQLLIGTVSNSYVWDTSDNTLTANGVPLLAVDFLNQLCLGVDSQRRFWRYSGLADATDWDTLDNEPAESSPDRIVGGIVSQGEWLVFGERTVEFWQNNPTDATAFQRGPVVEKGCANANTIQRLDNSVIWLGNDNIVYRMQGYTAVPISTKAMAASLEAASQAKAFAFTYEDRGYAVYYLTFQDGLTWGYDVTSQRWHRRHSMNLDRWRLNTLVRWNNAWYGGDYTDGTLHQLVWGHALEADAYLPRSFSSGVMHGDGNRVKVAAVKVLVDTGGEPSVADESIGISGDAPDAELGSVYTSYSYTAHNGTAPYTFAITAGSLPTGLALSGAGVITGTPSVTQTASFTVQVTDADGNTASLRDVIVIGPAVLPAAIAHWKLDDAGATAVDSSGNGFTLTKGGTYTNNSASASPSGVLSTRWNSGYAQIDPAPSGLILAEDDGTLFNMTVCCWVNQESGGGSVVNQLFGVTSDALAGHNNWNFTSGPSTCRAKLNSGSNGTSKTITGTPTPTISFPSSGVLLVVSITNGLAKAYVDGVLCETVQFGTYTTQTTGMKFYLGSHPDYPASFDFIGVISDAVIWDQGLTAAQVALLEASGLTGLTYKVLP